MPRLPFTLALRTDCLTAIILTQAPTLCPARVLAVTAARVLRRDQLAYQLGAYNCPRALRTVQGAA